jgi:hypothetical protein
VIHRKEIVLAEGDAVGGTQWTMATDNIVRDAIPGGTRITFPGSRTEGDDRAFCRSRLTSIG